MHHELGGDVLDAAVAEGGEIDAGKQVPSPSPAKQHSAISSQHSAPKPHSEGEEKALLLIALITLIPAACFRGLLPGQCPISHWLRWRKYSNVSRFWPEQEWLWSEGPRAGARCGRRPG